MENKNNFAGIIIPVIISVILLTVLPIVNSINVECPPCEECPSYNIGNLEVNPDFSSGNYIVDKGDYDYLDSVTIIKDNNLIPENIKKDVSIFGVVGTLESGGDGYGVVLYSDDMSSHSSIVDILQYSLDDGSTWIDITKTHNNTYFYIQDIIQNVTTIKFRASCSGSSVDNISIYSKPQYSNVLIAYGEGGIITSDNITLTDNQIFDIIVYED